MVGFSLFTEVMLMGWCAVRDAEAVRKILLKEDGKWSVLGQSFGGFCALHYISE